MNWPDLLALPPKKPVGPPGTWTLYPGAQAGYLQSDSASTYALARSGTGLTAVAVSSYAGQILSAGHYYCIESVFDFDTSVVTGVMSTATFSLGLRTDNSTTDFTVVAALYDWGTTLDTADYVPGASLGALTTVGTLATSGIGAIDAYKAFTESGSALRDNINRSGFTRLIVYSSRHEAAVAPTGDEYVSFHLTNHATLKPKLVVVTT